MYSCIKTSVLQGIDAVTVDAEADVSDGLPCIDMVGFLAGEVRESKERIRTALKNNGISMPAKRITINLAPASVRKFGSGLDLPIAIAILAALGIVSQEKTKDVMIVGELRLDGSVSQVSGVLPFALRAREDGFKKIIVPVENLSEARLVGGIESIGVSCLMEAMAALEDNYEPDAGTSETGRVNNRVQSLDFADISGQLVMKRACEIAVAGMHNILMVGPPGAGKTMLAKRLPTILPPLLDDERLEVSKIYSVCGLLGGEEGLIDKRPVRSPHHTISPAGMSGGGVIIKPGEVSLAHKGILFLDEMPEFSPASLEVLREPLEDKKIRITRAMTTVEYPADVLLACSMNACKCGYYPGPKCRCSKSSVEKYQSRISRPLMDRIDMIVEASPISFEELSDKGRGESSASIRDRVVKAQKIQTERYAGRDFHFNSGLPPALIDEYCGLDDEEKKLMERMYKKMELTARGYHKILKVARTIADLDGSDRITKKHLCEALCFRSQLKTRG